MSTSEGLSRTKIGAGETRAKDGTEYGEAFYVLL